MSVRAVADVVVIGAGPAGSAAATVLARAGRSVVVLDKATFPRDKCCGDGLTTLALRELEHLGFEPSMVPTWRSVDAAWIRSPSGREVR
ncbi:MAG TPA: FAD-dependent oxidoreductase, partial [Ilumatobacteraceae bacterium]|nr:FAD-dependent oxidoreductase [Ilumatobacteraceae bacterium]